MKICIVGSGYVGLSLAALIAKHHDVTLLDVSEKKIKQINERTSPIQDDEIENYFKDNKLNLIATLDNKYAYSNADFVIIATPTNYDIKSGSFDTSSVEDVISDVVKCNKDSTIVIKSTVPLGFTDEMKSRFKTNNIIFSPEFLRETKALYDNLYPSRIVVGDFSNKAKEFGNILYKCSNKKNIQMLFMESKEAEAVKLFSNTFLAMRVSFFNELDSFAEIQGLSSRNIIDGISSDPRVGHYYNNPSFGYGGYCLPKDTKQLLDNFSKIPNNIIKATVEANNTRKEFIVNSILKRSPKTVGIYRLTMKKGSDNFRESAVLDIVSKLEIKKINMVIYEPFINNNTFNGIPVINEIGSFIKKSDLIIANRFSNELDHVAGKVYSRDLFQEN